MWFKNLSVFRLTKPFTHDAQALHEQLQEQAFTPVSAQEPKSFGWTSPLGKFSDEFVHSANGYMMVCAKRQEKILPAAVVNEKLDEKLAVIEQEEARKLSRKEKTALKEEIQFDLLPKAFAKTALLFAYIAPQEGLIIVNSASAKASEELMSLLRESLGSLSVIPLTAKNLPLQTMTHWLRTKAVPEPFELGSEGEFKDLKTGGSIKCKEQDLLSDEILSHLESEMQVVQLALHWQERIQFVVDEKLTIKRLKYDDVIQEKASDVEAETAQEQFDVDFTLMTAELKPFIRDLIQAMGGEVDSEAYIKDKLEQAAVLEDEVLDVEELSGE